MNLFFYSNDAPDRVLEWVYNDAPDRVVEWVYNDAPGRKLDYVYIGLEKNGDFIGADKCYTVAARHCQGGGGRLWTRLGLGLGLPPS